VVEVTKTSDGEVAVDEETVVWEDKHADGDLVKKGPIIIQVQEVPIGC
jgi:hypothetical protein